MNYIYGNTLVLGDSSYLEHHGIKNQKWGFRRFQNPDGSLTAAGRIRYGVTGAAKAAFKVGKKLGAATASAARAGVKKAKDNAYEKKKEKASQTREGVLKNKKMFTNEELERLEKRFKIEDDMRNAGLRHGQEIAKTISAYSDAAVKTMNALQTSGKAVKAISDGLSALQDYKEKRDIGKKASDAGMSTADYKDYTKSRMEDKAKRDNERAQKKADEAEKRAAEYKEKQAQAKAEAEAKAKADKEEAERQSIEKSKDVARRQKQDIMDAIAAKKQAKADAEQAKKDQAAAERKELRALKKEAEERKALDKVNRIKAEEERLKSAAKKASQPEPLDTSEKGVKTVIKNSVAGTNKETSNSIRSAIQSIIKSSSGSKSGLDKLKKMAKDHAEDVKDSPDVDAVNDAYLKKLQSLLNNIKHSDMDELAHFGVKGMKWGKHLMAGKGSSTDISSGGGGGAPEEDDETIADILGIDVDTYRQKINEGPFGYGQYADQLGEKAEKLHAQAEANRKMADQVGLTGNKKKAAEFRKKSEQLKKDAVKAEKLKTYMNRRANGESALGITADTVNTTIVKPITGLAKDISRSVSASNPMNSDLVRKLRRVKHGSMDSFMIENGILRYGFDESDHLEHHGIKGQRWGVRRFQNADGSLTNKGRKHYQKKLAIEERKLTAANAARGQYERVRTPMSVGMGILGAVAGAMVGVPAGPAGIAAGAAIVSSIAASSNYAAYTVAGIVAGQGAKRNMKKIAKYKEALAQDAFEIQNGVLIYGSGQSEELKHFGLKGMKWGVRRFQNPDGSLTDTGKKRYSNTGELDSGGGGGGSDEEDEETKKKIEEAAKKASMTVDEYRKKFADKIAAMKKKDTSWKYDSSISTKDMQRMAKEVAEFTESVSKKAHEAAMAQNSSLRAGNKKRASTHGWAATQYNTLAKNEQTGGRYSAKNVKRNYDSTLEGKATKLRYATQRAKQRVYNAAGGKYKEEANTARVYREREKAKENRAIKNGNQYDAEAARSWQDLYSQSEKAMNSAYRKSIAGRYDALKAKRKKRYAKHSAFVKDGTLFLEYRGTNFPKR